jgi:bacterioferritin (cytochrome b1)
MAVQGQAPAGDLSSSPRARVLNAVLRNQFTSTNQVFLNSFILEHWGYHVCAERMYVESVRETGRSMRTLRHITLLGMAPDLMGTPGLYSAALPVVGRNLSEVFRIEKAHAQQSLVVVQEAITTYEATDEPAILESFRQAAEGQAEYVAWLADEDDALREMGDVRYLERQGATLQDGDLKAFILGVKEKSARDPEFSEVPESVKPADKSFDGRILGWLNGLLAIEIMSIERDFVDAFIFDCHGNGALTERITMDALGAMRRAQRITEHILALGETPAPDTLLSASPLPPAGPKIQDYLESERYLEEWKSSVAREALASPDLPPGPTRALVGALLRQSEMRAAWLATAIRGGLDEGTQSAAPSVRFQAILQRWIPA